MIIHSYSAIKSLIIFFTTEFDRLMKKHATQTGLPVIVDFYSDGCGPCRMIAPIFKKLAKEMEGKGGICQS